MRGEEIIRVAEATAGREKRQAWGAMPRHRHRRPYAALVLQGCYEEAGDDGRWWVEPGRILFHGRFHTHLDRFGGRETEILNIGLPSDVAFPPAASVRDPDEIVRIFEHDAFAAWETLLQRLLPLEASATDWPDQLAADMAAQPDLSLRSWGERRGLSPSTISRAFQQVYGTSPKRYRADAKARLALRLISDGQEPLSGVAAGAGFADQPHMTRAVARLTGAAPGWWRRARK